MKWLIPSTIAALNIPFLINSPYNWWNWICLIITSIWAGASAYDQFSGISEKQK